MYIILLRKVTYYAMYIILLRKVTYYAMYIILLRKVTCSFVLCWFPLSILFSHTLSLCLLPV